MLNTKPAAGNVDLLLALMIASVVIWSSTSRAQQVPYGLETVPANATCKALIDSGYVPPKFPDDGKPRIDQPNLLVQNCYPPYGNQIPYVSNTLPESGTKGVPSRMPPPKTWDKESAWNLEAVGFHDNQGRPVYQPFVFNYQNHTGSSVWRNREILFNGNAGGTARNCEIPGCPVQNNGTSIVDVTVPAKSKLLFHIPSGPTPSDPTEPIGDGAQMVRVCSGNQLNKDSSALSESANKGLGVAWKGNPAIANKVYLLRQNGKGTGSKTKNTAKQEIWDVTDPTAPLFVSDVLVDNFRFQGGGGPEGFVAAPLPPVLDHAHKNWWECDTGVAYIVGGKEADNFGTMQHIYVYNLRDPTHPVFIRQYAIAGGQRPAHENTGSCTNAPSDTCYQGTTNPPGGLHGPISMGNLVNRVYSAWGIMKDGLVQITARDKLINGCFTTAASAWEQTGTATGFNPSASSTCAAKPGSGINPSQSDSLFPQISVITMQTTQGGHSTMPVLGVPLPTEQSAYLDQGRSVGLDLLFVASEETASNCSGQAAHEAWIESIGVFQLPGAFPTAPGGFANVTGADDALRKTYSSTDDQQWPIATLGVTQQPGAFCAKGSRFGAHAITEAIFPAYYGRIQCASWFNGGERCWDVRNPKNPVPIAYWISRPGPATTPIGNLGATAASDGTYYSAPGGKGEQVTRKSSVANHGEFDDRGFLYVVDRAGTGTAILQFNGGAAAEVIKAKPVQPKACGCRDCNSCRGGEKSGTRSSPDLEAH
jgi:hypothetical protein